MSKDLKGSITISRVMSGRGDYISISIRDENSRNRFVEAKLDYATFGKLMSGLAEIECDFEVRGLENVGKVRIRKDRTLTLDKTVYDKDVCLAAIREHEKDMIEAGWHLSEYLGSRDSMTNYDGRTKLKYEIFKYVEEKDVDSYS